MDVLVVWSGVIFGQKNIDLLLQKLIGRIAQNDVLVGPTVYYLDLGIHIHEQLQDEVAFESRDVHEVPLDQFLELMFQAVFPMHADDKVAEELLMNELNEGVGFELGVNLEVILFIVPQLLIQGLDFLQGNAGL